MGVLTQLHVPFQVKAIQVVRNHLTSKLICLLKIDELIAKADCHKVVAAF